MQKRILLFHSSLAKSWLRAWQHLVQQTEFLNDYGRAATAGRGVSQEGRCPPNKNFARINPKATVGENIGSRGGVEDTRLEAKAKDPKKSNAKA